MSTRCPSISQGCRPVSYTHLNGIVHVSAKDLGTGKEQHITISSSSNMSKEDIDRAVKDAEQFAEQDKKRREEVDTKNNAENLCYTAEKLVTDSGDKMQDSDKNEINTKVAALRAVSYTHLDVYKRQIWKWSGWSPTTSPASGARPWTKTTRASTTWPSAASGGTI